MLSFCTLAKPLTSQSRTTALWSNVHVQLLHGIILSEQTPFVGILWVFSVRS